MKREQLRQLILQELPRLLREDLEVYRTVRHWVLEFAPSREEMEDRFERLLEELRREREEDRRRWEENQRKWEENQRRWEENWRMWKENQRRWEENQRRWEENQRKWEENQRRWEENWRMWKENQRRWEENWRMWKENQRRWEENQRRWEENQRKWEENQRKWEENQRKWEENQRRWEENQKVIHRLLNEIQKLHRKHDQSIGALGARWGLQSEETFRNALAGILKDYGIRVDRVHERDDEGMVFGRPDQVEIDLLVHNGKRILAEIKSSVSKADVFIFDRKVAFYRKRFGLPVDRKLIISPMVDPDAKEMAKQLDIEVYSFAEDAGEAITA